MRYCGLKFKHQIFGWIRKCPGPFRVKPEKLENEMIFEFFQESKKKTQDKHSKELGNMPKYLEHHQKETIFDVHISVFLLFIFYLSIYLYFLPIHLPLSIFYPISLLRILLEQQYPKNLFSN